MCLGTIRELGVTGRICIETGYVIIFLIVLMLLWLCGYFEEMKAETLKNEVSRCLQLSNDSVHTYDKILTPIESKRKIYTESLLFFQLFCLVRTTIKSYILFPMLMWLKAQ